MIASTNLVFCCIVDFLCNPNISMFFNFIESEFINEMGIQLYSKNVNVSSD